MHACISTRFSHSLEVSNLARGIGIRLAYDHRDEVFGDDADELKVERTVPALLATAGLAHDLGTPPFGHPGEEAIALWCQKRNIKLQDFSKFNSNCQTFRLLTRLETTNDNPGLDLTYATLAALLKYPVFCNDLRGLKKFGIFERERNIALEVWNQTGLAEGVRHPLAYIVEACDDIAYSAMDVEDIVRVGLASFEDVIGYLERISSCSKTKDVIDSVRKKCKDFRTKDSRELDRQSMLVFRMTSIAAMTKSVTTRFAHDAAKIRNGETDGEFEIMACEPDVGELCTLLKSFGRDRGFRNLNVRRRAKQCENRIRETMDYIWCNIAKWDSDSGCSCLGDYTYLRLPKNCRRVYEGTNRSSADKRHLLCDVVAGMTNSELTSLHDDLKEFARQ